LTKLAAGHGLAFSPDGNVLGVGHEKGVDLWDLKTKKLTATLPSSETIFAIAFSPDSSLLVGGGLVADRGSKPPIAVGHIFLWDVVHKQLLAKAECDKETSIGVAFLASGDQIIAGGEKLALYDRHKLERVAVFPDWRGPFTGDASVG
jgi:WD40 repeat protein